MNIFKEIINLYKDYLQKEKAVAKAYEEITEKVENGITLADQIIDVLKENKILKEQNKILKQKLEQAKGLLNEMRIALRQTKDGTKYNISLLEDVDKLLERIEK